MDESTKKELIAVGIRNAEDKNQIVQVGDIVCFFKGCPECRFHKKEIIEVGLGEILDSGVPVCPKHERELEAIDKIEILGGSL